MPGIPLSLVASNGNMLPRTYGLVDSGADYSNFPEAWAAALGIDVQTDCRADHGNTAGGLTKHYVYDPGVDAIIMGEKVHLDAVFCPGLPVILLGREDFFNVFKVSFDQRRGTFRVEAY